MVQEEETSYYTVLVGWFLSSKNDSDIIKEDTYHASYIVILVNLIIFGVCGISLNGWALYLFCKTKTVSLQFSIFYNCKSINAIYLIKILSNE